MRMEDNVYTFEVAKTANKVEIAQAVEAIFDVKVVKVNTANVKSSQSAYVSGRFYSYLEKGYGHSG